MLQDPARTLGKRLHATIAFFQRSVSNLYYQVGHSTIRDKNLLERLEIEEIHFDEFLLNDPCDEHDPILYDPIVNNLSE